MRRSCSLLLPSHSSGLLRSWRPVGANNEERQESIILTCSSPLLGDRGAGARFVTTSAARAQYHLRGRELRSIMVPRWLGRVRSRAAAGSPSPRYQAAQVRTGQDAGSEVGLTWQGPGLGRAGLWEAGDRVQEAADVFIHQI